MPLCAQGTLGGVIYADGGSGTGTKVDVIDSSFVGTSAVCTCLRVFLLTLPSDAGGEPWWPLTRSQ